MFSLEYQAVILAGGRGTRMTEITSSKAKCLLPIGNYPMIWYPLNMLKRIGFQGKSNICSRDWICWGLLVDIDKVIILFHVIILLLEVIVVTLETAKAEIAGIPKKYNLDMVLDVVAIPAQSMSGSISSQTEEFGTADAIRYIHDKLKASRIMIISSDLITDVQVRKK